MSMDKALASFREVSVRGERLRVWPDGRIEAYRQAEWHTLNVEPDRSGYASVRLWRAGTRSRCRVHLLVLEAFHGPRPSCRHVARHANDDRMDPSADNLCWGTRLDNYEDARRNGRCIPKRVYGAVVRRRVRRLREAGLAYSEIAGRVGMNEATAWRIVNG